MHREQASLAIALILVGAPAWFFHFRVVERAARASVVERTSPIRSFYVHAVVFTMAMLVFSYGQAALGLALQGLFFGGWPTFGPGGIGLDPSWQARSAGAAAMALAAAVVLAYHVRLSLRDKRAVLFTGRAAQLRHFAVYLLVAVGVVWSSYLAINGLNQVWQYVADQLVTPPGLAGFVPPSGFTAVRFPTREDFLVFQLLGVSSGIAAGLALWLGTWIPRRRAIETYRFFIQYYALLGLKDRVRKELNANPSPDIFRLLNRESNDPRWEHQRRGLSSSHGMGTPPLSR